jgi:hypothetical protein
MHRARARSMLCAKHSSRRESSLVKENARDLNRRTHREWIPAEQEEEQSRLRITAALVRDQPLKRRPYAPAAGGDASGLITVAI